MSDALRETQTADGATFAADNPSSQPTTFGDATAEYTAASSNVALFDLTDRIHIAMTGDDRHKFLHNFCTNDINGLRPGLGCEAFVCNDKGRVLAHINVFTEEETLWVESGAGSESTICNHLDHYLITEDVEIADRSSEFGQLFVSGLQAAVKLETAGLPVDSLVPFGHRQLALDGVDLRIRRFDLLGTTGFTFVAKQDELDKLWSRLRELGIAPAGQLAFESLRIEAGYPNYGEDISDANLAQEVARTKTAICFTKGCYLGQEPIARIDALGHVNRELRRIRFEEDSAPVVEAGACLVSGDDNRDAAEITSAVRSLRDGHVDGLAYVRRGFLDPTTELRLSVESGDFVARIVDDAPNG